MAIFTNHINQEEPAKKIELTQNDPNLFRKRTVFRYSIPYRTKVVIMINNVDGQIIDKIIIPKQERGLYELEFFADGLPKGIYFDHLIADNIVKSGEMELIK